MSDSKLPSLIAYTVIKKDPNNRDEKGYWHKIGAAWNHKSGPGLTIRLEVMPFEREIVLMPPTDKVPD